jgi:hypothetical protein
MLDLPCRVPLAGQFQEEVYHELDVVCGGRSYANLMLWR